MAPILLVHRLRLARPRRAPALVIIRVHRIAEAEPVLASPSSPCASSLSTFYRGTSPWKIEPRLPLEHPLSGSARGRGPGPGGLWHAKHCWARPVLVQVLQSGRQLRWSLVGECAGQGTDTSQPTQATLALMRSASCLLQHHHGIDQPYGDFTHV